MLEIKNLSCGYKDKDVVKNIEFTINKGESISIIGPNGCGKSTLLKALGGILEYNGSIKIEGKELKHLKKKELAKKIALMSQSSEIFFDYTVYETVALGRYAYLKDMFSTYSKEDKGIILTALESVNILDIKDRNIRELSGGQLQRVYLARAFVQEPEIILLDEPTNHLDLKCQIEILDYINKWAKEKNKIVIQVLHDLNLVGAFSERTMLLKDGKIEALGASEKILKEDKIKEIYEIDIRKFMLEALERWR